MRVCKHFMRQIANEKTSINLHTAHTYTHRETSILQECCRCFFLEKEVEKAYTYPFVQTCIRCDLSRVMLSESIHARIKLNFIPYHRCQYHCCSKNIFRCAFHSIYSQWQFIRVKFAWNSLNLRKFRFCLYAPRRLLTLPTFPSYRSSSHTHFPFETYIKLRHINWINMKRLKPLGFIEFWVI